jgi:hypothetical protein
MWAFRQPFCAIIQEIVWDFRTSLWARTFCVLQPFALSRSNRVIRESTPAYYPATHEAANISTKR